ncbi:hypothetical protein ES703_112849 [subsurface metagenome]
MFFSANIWVSHLKSVSSPQEDTIKCSAGIIHQIDILFPVNSNREVFVKLLDEGYQLFPTNMDGYIRANNTIIASREFYELSPDRNTITVVSYNEHKDDDFLISVMLVGKSW